MTVLHTKLNKFIRIQNYHKKSLENPGNAPDILFYTWHSVGFANQAVTMSPKDIYVASNSIPH